LPVVPMSDVTNPGTNNYREEDAQLSVNRTSYQLPSRHHHTAIA
jgi:hypothetical protein